MPSPTKKQAELRAFRATVSRLHKAGLVHKDARKAKPTRYMKARIKEFAPFLNGEADVVTVPRRKDAKAFEGRYTNVFNKVLVPKPKSVKQRARYSKKRKDIIVSENYGETKIVWRAKKYTLDGLRAFEGRPNIYFRVSIRRGGSYEYYTVQNLQELIDTFDRSSWRGFSNWADFVQIGEAVRGKQHAHELFGDEEIEDDE